MNENLFKYRSCLFVKLENNGPILPEADKRLRQVRFIRLWRNTTLMHYLYVLESSKVKRKYIGITVDCKKRLEKHNLGKVRSTKAYKPWKVIYIEEFATIEEAARKERELKSNSWKRNVLFVKLENNGPIV